MGHLDRENENLKGCQSEDPSSKRWKQIFFHELAMVGHIARRKYATQLMVWLKKKC